VTLASCIFKTGVQYCGKLYFGSPPPPPQAPDTSLPIRVSDVSTASFPSFPIHFSKLM
jgi:hypothetical protein